MEIDKTKAETQHAGFPKGQATDQAEAALQLLRSLANASASPENLERAFLDWSRLADDARTNPEFGYILTNIIGSSSRKESALSPTSNVQQSSGHDYDFEDIFFLNGDGVIIDVSSKLASLLNLKIGDAIEPALFQRQFEQEQKMDAESKSNWTHTIELRDRFNIKRRIVIHKIGDRQSERRYAAVYVRLVISEEAKHDLQSQYGLTKSEMEILELATQRYNPDQIATLRKSKLNTVRTHISRLIHKMECNSLNEAIGLSIEVSLTKSESPATFFNSPSFRANSLRKVTIPEQDAIVEYRRYGPLSGKPVIVLHSLEYGYEPSQAFIDEARARKLCLYFPLRPGFGSTTSFDSLDASAVMMAGFLDAVDIADATIVALSTSAPLAVAIPNTKDRIKHLILVNYGLNAESKVDTIEPKWIRGMIKMALAAPASFAVGLESVRTFFKTFGTKRFYRMLYSGIDVDQNYMEQNEMLFDQSGSHMIKANRLNIRLDIISSFMTNRDLPHHIANQKLVTVANGEQQHKVPPQQAVDNARSLGVRLEIIPNGGRNWPFVRPDALFDLLEVDQ